MHEHGWLAEKRGWLRAKARRGPQLAVDRRRRTKQTRRLGGTHRLGLGEAMVCAPTAYALQLARCGASSLHLALEGVVVSRVRGSVSGAGGSGDGGGGTTLGLQSGEGADGTRSLKFVVPVPVAWKTAVVVEEGGRTQREMVLRDVCGRVRRLVYGDRAAVADANAPLLGMVPRQKRSGSASRRTARRHRRWTHRRHQCRHRHRSHHRQHVADFNQWLANAEGKTCNRRPMLLRLQQMPPPFRGIVPAKLPFKWHDRWAQSCAQR